MATDVTPEMLSIIERLEGLRRGDPGIVGGPERWRGASPEECWEHMCAICDEGAALLAQLPEPIQARFREKEQIPDELLAVLAGRA